MLHTGDFRAEPVFIGSIMKNPFLRRYIAHDNSSQSEDLDDDCDSETLEAIYLDTANMLNTDVIPPKARMLCSTVDIHLTFIAE